MKPLSIEEIKQFETGYFIYIVVIYEKTNSYYKIDKINNENLCLKLDDLGDYAELPFSEYGKTWLAYRNKEYADCKGELVELPRIIHPNELEWFVQYQYPSGIIDYKLCFSLEQAEQKLKELRGGI